LDAVRITIVPVLSHPPLSSTPFPYTTLFRSGDMYEGAFIPGLVLALLYASHILLVTIFYPKAAPGLPVDAIGFREPDGARGVWQDRKSTRLNSSHLGISYAVFCLKKKDRSYR